MIKNDSDNIFYYSLFIFDKNRLIPLDLALKSKYLKLLKISRKQLDKYHLIYLKKCERII